MLIRILTGLVVGAPLALAALSAPVPRRSGTYRSHERGRYGPIWRDGRPPGLPDVRRCSAAGEAATWIEQAIEREHHKAPIPGRGVFTRTVLHLAETESGQMFGRPANNYDNRAKAQRPEGKPRISAWGCFQWNEGAGRNAGHMAKLGVAGPGYGPTWEPHQMSAWEEIDGPIRMYAQLWRAAKAAKATDTDAARLVRLWHKKSSPGRTLLKQAQISRDWAREYASAASAADRGVVDRHLRNAGVSNA